MPDPDRRPHGAELARELADAAQALRTDAHMRPEWRDALLADVESVPAADRPRPAPEGPRLSLHPFAAALAAAALIALGALGSRVLLPCPAAPTAVSTGMTPR